MYENCNGSCNYATINYHSWKDKNIWEFFENKGNKIEFIQWEKQLLKVKTSHVYELLLSQNAIVVTSF